MKFIVPFVLSIFLFSAQLFAREAGSKGAPDEKSPFKITWIDLAFNNYVPIPGTRFADFSKVNFGGSVGLNFMAGNIRPLWLFVNIMAKGNVSNTRRMDRLIDMGIGAGLGWRVDLVKDRFFFTPRLSYGYMLHAFYGSYFNDQRIYLISAKSNKKRHHLFSDQYLQLGLEFAVAVSPRSNSPRCELFLAPEFTHFIEKHRQGLEVGYRLGFRINLEGAAHATKDEGAPPPAVLAGRAIDAETRRVLPLTAPLLAGGVSRKTGTVGNETFAYTVNAGRDYTIKVDLEGYDPAAMEVKGADIKSGTRMSVTIPLKRTRVWGIFGHIFEKESNDPLNNVEVLVTEKATGSKTEMKSDGNGDFRMELKPAADYDVVLKKRRYFTVRGDFSTRGRAPGWFDVNKFMRTEFQKVVVGAALEFGSIYYDSGSWQIRPDVTPELDKIVQFLNDNPEIIVELGAHTDSMGDAGQNMELSQKRAESAVAYLVRKGIPASRITAKGYGETKIKNRCVDGVACSPGEHQENRRTEITVTKITR